MPQYVIGGAGDGMIAKDGYHSFRVMKMPDRNDDSGRFQEDTYRLEKIATTDGNGKPFIHELYILNGMSTATAMQRLLERYTETREKR